MSEIAVFSAEVAAELIKRGYAVRGRSRLAWFFDDNDEIEAAVAELVATLI